MMSRNAFTGDPSGPRRWMGPGDRGAALRRRADRAGGADRAGARQPAADDEAPGQPVPVSQGLHATQVLGTVFDGVARHTAEGYAFQGPGRARGLPRGRPRPRRALRRPRALDVQGMRDVGTVATSTRERLLVARAPAIEEGGYGGASVIAIAERAGVAAGTLYRHFASKEELFVEVFRSVCEREERAMRAAAAQCPQAPRAGALETVLATFAAAGPAQPPARLGADRRTRRPARRRRADRLPGAVRRADRAGLAGRDRGGRAARAERRAHRGRAGRRLWRGAGGAAVAAGGGRPDPDEIVAALRTFIRRAVGAP